jgi:alkanesulfonate monooxygenase
LPATTGAVARAPGDGTATDLRGELFGSFDHLVHRARAAEASGFDGVVVRFDPAGEDPVVAATAIARRTRRLTVVPEIVSSLATPVYAAKMSVTLQRLSGNRLGWLIDADGPGAGPAYGDNTSLAERLARHHEFLRIARAVSSSGPVDLVGEFFSVAGGGFGGPLADRPFPSVIVSGASSGSLELAAALGDRHLFSDADTGWLAHQIHRLQMLAADRQRDVSAAVAVTVVARDTDAEADDALRSLPAPATERVVAGSYERVAAQLDALVALGVAELVIDLHPFIDEAYRFGHHVRPLLIERGAVAVEHTNGALVS